MGLEKAYKSLAASHFEAGPQNAITDVAGVAVGAKTISQADVHTGVTAVLAHGGNLFEEKVPAGHCVFNGYGKSAGLMQLAELGTIETPIVLTNTLSVGTAFTALVRYMMEANPGIGGPDGSVNPLVCECNDGFLSDIRSLAVTEADVFDAIKAASPIVEEGSAGAGAGMCCHGFKGGIGTSSRLVEIGDATYTLGCLVLTNHSDKSSIILPGFEAPKEEKEDKGSVIVLLATDAPLPARQLNRLSRRAASGLARTGNWIGHSSGELAIAFSTAYTIPQHPTSSVLSLPSLHDSFLNPLFRAAAEAVCESVYSSMLHAGALQGFFGSAPSLKSWLDESKRGSEA